MNTPYQKYTYLGQTVLLIPGSRFTKKELNSRLHQMDVQYDQSNQSKNYFVNLYENALKYNVNKQKIFDKLLKDTIYYNNVQNSISNNSRNTIETPPKNNSQKVSIINNKVVSQNEYANKQNANNNNIDQHQFQTNNIQQNNYSYNQKSNIQHNYNNDFVGHNKNQNNENQYTLTNAIANEIKKNQNQNQINLNNQNNYYQNNNKSNSNNNNYSYFNNENDKYFTFRPNQNEDKNRNINYNNEQNKSYTNEQNKDINNNKSNYMNNQSDNNTSYNDYNNKNQNNYTISELQKNYNTKKNQLSNNQQQRYQSNNQNNIQQNYNNSMNSQNYYPNQSQMQNYPPYYKNQNVQNNNNNYSNGEEVNQYQQKNNNVLERKNCMRNVDEGQEDNDEQVYEHYNNQNQSPKYNNDNNLNSISLSIQNAIKDNNNNSQMMQNANNNNNNYRNVRRPMAANNMSVIQESDDEDDKSNFSFASNINRVKEYFNNKENRDFCFNILTIIIIGLLILVVISYGLRFSRSIADGTAKVFETVTNPRRLFIDLIWGLIKAIIVGIFWKYAFYTISLAIFSFAGYIFMQKYNFKKICKEIIEDIKKELRRKPVDNNGMRTMSEKEIISRYVQKYNIDHNIFVKKYLKKLNELRKKQNSLKTCQTINENGVTMTYWYLNE